MENFRNIFNRKVCAMKLKEAIKRLGFTISKQNKPNQTDADAFNLIIDYFKASEEKTIQENLLFAKLYAYTLQEFTRCYDNPDIANKKLNELLSQTMEMRIEMLLRQLKYTELHNCFKDPILQNKSYEELRAVFNTHKKFEKEFLTCWDWWNYENTSKHLETNINLSIQKFKNHV